jgi:hypothetical protein
MASRRPAAATSDMIGPNHVTLQAAGAELEERPQPALGSELTAAIA